MFLLQNHYRNLFLLQLLVLPHLKSETDFYEDETDSQQTIFGCLQSHRYERKEFYYVHDQLKAYIKSTFDPEDN